MQNEKKSEVLENPKKDEVKSTEAEEKGFFATIWDNIVNFFKEFFGITDDEEEKEGEEIPIESEEDLQKEPEIGHEKPTYEKHGEDYPIGTTVHFDRETNTNRLNENFFDNPIDGTEVNTKPPTAPYNNKREEKVYNTAKAQENTPHR